MTVNDQDPYSATQMDSDPEETAEWSESLDALVASQGHQRGREIMLSLLKRSKELHLGVPMVPTTDYLNTIAPENEPEFPGDEALERRYRAWIRWNAAMLVHRAQRPGIAVGGHISTYASSAALYEVGFNHFFRGQDHPGGGDQIYIQGHASPAPTRAPSSRAGSPPTSSTASARRSRTRRTGCPPTRTRVCSPSSGSSRPCRWGSARSTPSTRRNSTST
ncbi:hypothetical protein GCM10025877_32380 [Agromyces mangrovi Wang et al. 2018]|nr:hypothetical protein GCM10025877_32380 [Agromyces mangrovi]